LNKIKGISCIKQKAIFYLFTNVKETEKFSEEVYNELLTKGKVVVIPGPAFSK